MNWPRPKYTPGYKLAQAIIFPGILRPGYILACYTGTRTRKKTPYYPVLGKKIDPGTSLVDTRDVNRSLASRLAPSLEKILRAPIIMLASERQLALKQKKTKVFSMVCLSYTLVITSRGHCIVTSRDIPYVQHLLVTLRNVQHLVHSLPLRKFAYLFRCWLLLIMDCLIFELFLFQAEGLMQDFFKKRVVEEEHTRFINIIFLTRGTCNPSGFQKIRDNIVMGWLRQSSMMSVPKVP